MKMNKYILAAFAFMAVGFYELSGGADFEPGDEKLVVFAEPKPSIPEPSPEPSIVARADTAALTEVTPASAVIEQPETTETTQFNLVSAAASDVRTQDAAAEAEPVNIPEPDFRFVDGDRVNMRGGPGTDYAVIGKLYRNDMIEILKDEGNGWLHLRDTITGEEGWIADWLVTASN
jgi:hypothetical protein